MANLGSGKNKLKLSNVQIVEIEDVNGIELKFHYSIRSKTDETKKKLVFSSIVENVSEMDMRLLIKTRKERNLEPRK